jgi:ABC transport system ATP-binding/permease protein
VGLKQLSVVSPSRWGLAAAASTVNLNVITAPNTVIDPLWTQTSQNWLRDMGIMIGLAVIFALLAYIKLRSLGPRRRK